MKEAKGHTKEEVYEAVTKELVKANKALGIKKKLTSGDYVTLGIVNQAMKNHLK